MAQQMIRRSVLLLVACSTVPLALPVAAQTCPNLITLDLVAPQSCYQQGDILIIEVNMTCLQQPVTGFQAFLEFDQALLAYQGSNSSYTAGPFPLHIQPIETAEINAGELNLDGSVNFGAPGSDQNALLATLTFEVQAGNDGVSTAVAFRDASPFVSELSVNGVPVPTPLENSESFAIDQTPPIIGCPSPITTDNDPGLCDAALAPGPATATDACGVETIVGVRDDSLPLTDPYPAGCDPSDPDGITIITWTATDFAGHTDACTQTITVLDTETPDLDVPPNVTIKCGEDDQPSNTGQATATDNCDPSPVVTFTDTVIGTCPAVIIRTWTATDACGNSVSQNQTISLGAEPRTLIIKQGTCPAPVNPNSNGVVPMLLVGELDFNVREVIQGSLELRRCDGEGGFVTPLNGPPGPKMKVKDLDHPFDGEVGCDGPCACNPDQSSDGIKDLSMKFRTADLMTELGLDAEDGLVVLTLTGLLEDGSAFFANDCIEIVPPGEEDNNLIIRSDIPDTFIELEPMDLRVDGEGFASFGRAYPPGTAVTVTAPLTSRGRRFLRWSINGDVQQFGVRTLEIIVDEELTLWARYGQLRRIRPDHPTESDESQD